jgi:bacillolysin
MNPTTQQSRILDRLKKSDPRFEFTWNDQTGTPLRMRGAWIRQQSDKPAVAAMDFLEEMRTLYGMRSPRDELQLLDEQVDRTGNTYLKYQQMAETYPVYAHELRMHIRRDAIIRGIHGRFVPEINLPQDPVISGDRAMHTALKHDPGNKKGPLSRIGGLTVWVEKERIPHLAWQIFVEGEEKACDGRINPAFWCYFIDSREGQVLGRYNQELTYTPAIGKGTGKYSGFNALHTMHDPRSGTYRLEDAMTGTSARIVTHNARGGYPPAPVSEDPGNTWYDACQQEEVDCHCYTRRVFDYYRTNHGRDSYDDQGAEMHIYAHCGSNWNNASWNGFYVKIGDGDGMDNDSLCTLDVIAHEWTHAVIQHTANLINSNQPGALNESLSDVLAALIDGNWLQGDDCWLKNTAPSGRNLQDPTNKGNFNPQEPVQSMLNGHQPDHMNDRYRGTKDHGGVHINCGIMNKAAYLMAMGGKHRGVEMGNGLGNEMLGELYYHAMKNYLVMKSDFADMKEAVLDSLRDLYENHASYEKWRAVVINAFAAVGIGQPVSGEKISLKSRLQSPKKQK